MIYALYTLGFLATVLLLALFEQLGVPGRWIGYGLAVLTLAFCVLGNVLPRVLRDKEGVRHPGPYEGMAIAGHWISAGTFVGLAGTLYLLGYDGLAFLLGFTGGFFLLALLMAPFLSRFGAHSVPDFFSARYKSRPLRAMIVAVLVCCSFVYLVAQIYAAALIGQRLLGLDFAMGVYVALAAVVVCGLFGGAKGVLWAQAGLFTVLLVAYLTPVVILSLRHYGFPVPQLTYGLALGDISSLELSMLKKRLADARTLKAHLQPFLNLNWLNFFGLILCLMAGTASMPHILGPFLAEPSANVARRSVAWSLLFVFLICATAPAYAVFSKLELFGMIDRGTSLSALPDWIYAYGKLGLIRICGADAADPSVVAAACAKISGTRGMLRYTDLSLDPDAVTLMTPEIVGLPYIVGGLVAAGGLAAALFMTGTLLGTIVDVVTQGLRQKVAGGDAPAAYVPVVSRTVLALVAACAAFTALTKPSDILTMVSWAFSLAAAGIFPALVLGIWWKRTSSTAAMLGALLGFAICVYYLVGTRYFAPSFFEMWSFLSNASPPAVGRYEALKEAWLAAAPERQAIAWTALDTHAQSIANWWGIRNSASAIFALPVGFIVIFMVSLLRPASRP